MHIPNQGIEGSQGVIQGFHGDSRDIRGAPRIPGGLPRSQGDSRDTGGGEGSSRDPRGTLCTVLYSTVQYCTVITVRYCAVLYGAVQYCVLHTPAPLDHSEPRGYWSNMETISGRDTHTHTHPHTHTHTHTHTHLKTHTFFHGNSVQGNYP